jgi:hypothetical protein
MYANHKTRGLAVATAEVWSPWVAALTQRLRELGWIEGRTIAIEYRWADGRSVRRTIPESFLARADKVVE